MIISVYVPLLAALLIGRCLKTGRFLPRHPAVQTWTITVGSAATAVLSTWSLVLLATARIDRVAYVTERVHLVGGLLRRAEHVPLPVSILAVVLLAVRARRVMRALGSSRRARRAADRFCDRNSGTLVVVADDEPIAFALAGNRRHPGTVVLSTALFDAVPADQRRAVLAHEHAHLALHHHSHRGVVNVAIALEPSLAPAHNCQVWRLNGGPMSTGRTMERSAALPRRQSPHSFNVPRSAGSRRLRWPPRFLEGLPTLIAPPLNGSKRSSTRRHDDGSSTHFRLSCW